MSTLYIWSVPKQLSCTLSKSAFSTRWKIAALISSFTYLNSAYETFQVVLLTVVAVDDPKIIIGVLSFVCSANISKMSFGKVNALNGPPVESAFSKSPLTARYCLYRHPSFSVANQAFIARATLYLCLSIQNEKFEWTNGRGFRVIAQRTWGRFSGYQAGF